MRFVKKKGLLEDFLERRSFFIRQYTNGDITKKEFLEYNYDYFISINKKPFININSYEKGMYNYQYYNALAKYYRMLAKDVKNTKKHNRYYNYYLSLSDKYYNEKDLSILNLLKLQKFENIKSYYIECESKSLRNILYEIVLEDKKEAIFHSKSKWLLDILIDKNVFLDEIKSSLIEEYINERY